MARHRARAAGTRYIVCSPSMASPHRRPASSTLGAMNDTPSDSSPLAARRIVVLIPIALACATSLGTGKARASDKRWIEAAEEMKKQAQSSGDQAFGAVLVKDNRIIGFGPSRVVKTNDPDAHAEREAIKHALSEIGAWAVTGSILYSTSRPCRLCEVAAANAGVQRMYFGQTAQDAGAPRSE